MYLFCLERIGDEAHLICRKHTGFIVKIKRRRRVKRVKRGRIEKDLHTYPHSFLLRGESIKDDHKLKWPHHRCRSRPSSDLSVMAPKAPRWMMGIPAISKEENLFITLVLNRCATQQTAVRRAEIPAPWFLVDSRNLLCPCQGSDITLKVRWPESS